MHEMPAGAQLIRALEWEQVGMWWKRGRTQNKVTLAKHIYKTDGNTNAQMINILLMQYRHLSVKQSNFFSSIFLFPHWKGIWTFWFLLLVLCWVSVSSEKKQKCLQREAAPDVLARSKTWHCCLPTQDNCGSSETLLKHHLHYNFCDLHNNSKKSQKSPWKLQRDIEQVAFCFEGLLLCCSYCKRKLQCTILWHKLSLSIKSNLALQQSTYILFLKMVMRAP